MRRVIHSAEALIEGANLEILRTYFEFAHKRQEVFLKREARWNGPLAEDPILQEYRFTNVFRVLDRVSQYLVSHVQTQPGLQDAKSSTILRTLLFKIFNKIETWERIEGDVGLISMAHFPVREIGQHLSTRRAAGEVIYSSAYIMPSPRMGQHEKHLNHLALVKALIEDGTFDRLTECQSLKQLFETLITVSSFGPFLAFQYAIDLNYSTHFSFPESDFVIAGPGAHDGLSKCFRIYKPSVAEDLILAVSTHQAELFAHFGLDLLTYKGRSLRPIDCQNLFCEVSKYTRVSHPDTQGCSGRTRIKQKYKPSFRPTAPTVLPVCWANC